MNMVFPDLLTQDYKFTLEPKMMARIIVNSRSNRLKYKIWASNRIKLFVVDDNGLNDIRSNRRFKYYNQAISGSYLKEELILGRGRWYFLVYNPNDEQISFNYDISEDIFPVTWSGLI